MSENQNNKNDVCDNAVFAGMDKYGSGKFSVQKVDDNPIEFMQHCIQE